jgi:hypothetical protein
MLGVPDPIYAQARITLLDGLEALRDQLAALIVVGAQAVYLHTGEGDLAVPLFTTDADIALDPAELHTDPEITAAMSRGGFVPHATEPGIYVSARGVTVDLLVPEALAGAGRRAARIPGHERRAARRAHGLEAALVDKVIMVIDGKEFGDTRAFEVAVAGRSALLVSKVVKIAERTAKPSRLKDKDALDILRLLRSSDPDNLARVLGELVATDSCRKVTQEAIEGLGELFGSPDSLGSQMAASAASPMADPEVIAASCAALTQELLEILSSRN